jgi:hypothetical protein
VDENDKLINAECENIDSTLEQISKELKFNETLILDIEDNCCSQSDTIYDTLVMRGYDVKKSFKKGRNQIVVNKKT